MTITDLNATQLARLRSAAEDDPQHAGLRRRGSHAQGRRVHPRRGAGHAARSRDRATTARTLFYVAFFGTPSTSRKWTVQFGGHHLAIHMTFSGSTRLEHAVLRRRRADRGVPGRRQDLRADGGRGRRAVRRRPLAQRRRSARRRGWARASTTCSSDRRRTGSSRPSEGITVSTLSAAQQTFVTRAIRAYVGDMPTAEANRPHRPLQEAVLADAARVVEVDRRHGRSGRTCASTGPGCGSRSRADRGRPFRRPLPLDRARHEDGLWRGHVVSRPWRPRSCSPRCRRPRVRTRCRPRRCCWTIGSGKVGGGDRAARSTGSRSRSTAR